MILRMWKKNSVHTFDLCLCELVNTLKLDSFRVMIEAAWLTKCGTAC